MVYYNENNAAAVAVLRELILQGVIAHGIVDDRSIEEVTAEDVKGYKQWHFFAGGGLWSLACRMAGIRDTQEILTGSCPCQPFSAAGRHQGINDPRHLWPHLHRLISAIRPALCVGEQVSGKPGYGWLDGIFDDLEAEDYTCGAIDAAACAVDAPHQRSRLWWYASMGNAESVERSVSARRSNGSSVCESTRADGSGQVAGTVADTCSEPRQQDTGSSFGYEAEDGRGSKDNYRYSGQNESRVGDGGNSEHSGLEGFSRHGNEVGHAQQGRPVPEADGCTKSYWGADWIECYDGKARRTQPGICFLVNGVSVPVPASDDGGIAEVQNYPKGRIEAWQIAGNAIVPQLAATFLQSITQDN